MKKISVSVVLIALVGVFAFSGVAQAKTKRVDSDISLRYVPGDSFYEENDVFKGRVNSKKRKCERERKVRLIQKGVGQVGRDETNRRGRYKIALDNAGDGRYVAKVKRKTYRKNNGNKVVCRRAKSNVVVVG